MPPSLFHCELWSLSFLHCHLPPATCHSCSRPLCLCLCCICHTIQQLWPSTLCFSLFNSFGYWTRLSLRCCLSSLLHCCLGWRLQHLGNLSQTLCESYKFAPQFVQNFWATLGCNSLTRCVPLPLAPSSLSLSTPWACTRSIYCIKEAQKSMCKWGA